MGLLGNIYIGYSGLYTESVGLKVSANNVSNLNTIGFKKDRIEFEDRIAKEIETFLTERGYGTFIKDIRIDFSEGGMISTGNPTDLAISGKGFFIVSDEEGNIYYTRDGQFFINEVDEKHFGLQNSLGMYLLGAEPDATSAEITTLKPYLIPKIMEPKATSLIKTQLIFDSQEEVNDVPLWEKYQYDPENSLEPIKNYNYDWVWDLPIYTSDGEKINLKLYADRGAELDEYEILLALEDPNLDGRGDGRYKGAFLYGTITFNSSGDINSVSFKKFTDLNNPPEDLTADDWVNGHPKVTININGAIQEIELDLGFIYNPDTGELERTENASKMLASSFAQLYYNQDGYPMGVFERIEMISEEGLIKVWYTNYKTLEVAKIFLADFKGYEESLEKVGHNLFKAKHGVEPLIFSPGILERGRIISGVLENSNVDLAEEMVRLIVLQRSFQSNARIITTSDQLLQDFLRQV